MIVEFRLGNDDSNQAFLKTIYDAVEELNCKCTTYLEERYNKKKHKYEKLKVVKVYGSDTMVGYLQFRIERYHHFVKKLSGDTLASEE